MARKAFSKRQRFEIFKRDGFTCQYCGAQPPKAILHVDHIVPVVGGGGNEDTNLVTSCANCNMGKAARLLGVVPQSLADRAAETAEREEQLRGFSEIMEAKRQRVEDDTWDVADIFISQFNRDIRKDYFQSIKRFVELMGVVACKDAMDLAISRKPFHETTCFRYFCGICWRLIKGGSDGG